MITPKSTYDSIAKFQETNLHEDLDYTVLEQRRTQLETLITKRESFIRNLCSLFHKVQKTKNYQEFVDVLMESRDLLQEIFTVENGFETQKWANHDDIPQIDWDKFSLDINAYIAENDQLLALYEDGLL
ncbi:ahc2p [Saccharomyces arboricola H-6]|uniref:Ahc2p n=1 Tax=Saccharomyces arboricola (strain H-6 / AS 2.3317 / CBS 10644) TaxID=1160507 RepID=J8QA63_SACAR|nr:ahc2p [Saccharomyces arboricola H-6]